MFFVEDDPVLVQAVTDLLGKRGYMSGEALQHESQSLSTIRFGNVRANFRKSEVLRDGERIALSERENRLLHFLVVNRGKTLSRDTLLEHVWGYRRPPLTRTVDVTILRLRQKIEVEPRVPKFIITVPGFGYRFST